MESFPLPRSVSGGPEERSGVTLPILQGGIRPGLSLAEQGNTQPSLSTSIAPRRVGEVTSPMETVPVTRMGPVTATPNPSPPPVINGTCITAVSNPDSVVSVAPVTTATLPVYSTAAVAMPLLGQLPQIPKFSGDLQDGGETFLEWLEQLENIAKLVGWDDHWRLVHLTSNLRGTAASFYRSCGVDVRSQYKSLVEAMKRRFTPVRLTAVQTQLFHNRQQAEGETVEQFAQDLQKLFNQAYARAAREGPEAEKLARTLLTNQFIAGLHSELKRKLIGVEGDLEELILKARFEEAKGRELTSEPNPGVVMTKHSTSKFKSPSHIQSSPTTAPQAAQKAAPPTSDASTPGEVLQLGSGGAYGSGMPLPSKE